MTYQVIRKNSTKKIEALLAAATKITTDVQTRDWHSDCFETSTRSADLAEVREFMADQYGRLRLVLELNEDGSHKGLRIELNGWSSKEFYVSFMPNTDVIPTIEPVEEAPKPRLTLAQVQAYMAKGMVSPLTSGRMVEASQEDLNKEIVSVKVIWSESNAFNDVSERQGEEPQLISLDEYNRREWLALLVERAYGNVGYAKTKVELHLGSGQVVTFRHDICVRERNLQTQWSNWVDHLYAEEA